MANLKLGKIMFTPKGKYNSATTYGKFDVIEYEGSTFLVLKEVAGVLPEHGEYYQLIAKRGEVGQKGDPGVDGVDGEDGRTAVFRYNEDALEWKYTDEDDGAWKTLVDVSDISAYAESAAASAAEAKESAQHAANIAGGGVSSFKGRNGAVMPQAGDYTAEMVGADSAGKAKTLLDNHVSEADPHPDKYAAKEHEHDDYASAEHFHEGYADAEHTHAEYAESGHNHDGYASAEHDHGDTYAAKEHEHDGYASAEHDHGGYADTDHTHEGYAASEHTHDYSETYASAEHTHDGYADAEHDHNDVYAAAKHGHTATDISDFSEAVAKLIPSAASGVQIAVGTYTGNGSSGKTYVNFIELTFEPKFVYIMGGSNCNKGVAIQGRDTMFVDVPNEDDEGNGLFYRFAISAVWNENTLQWYYSRTSTSNETYAEIQLNSKGAVYHYFAIG